MGKMPGILSALVLVLPLATTEIVCSGKASDGFAAAKKGKIARSVILPRQTAKSKAGSRSAADNEIERKSPFGMHPAYILERGFDQYPYKDAQYIGVKWHRPAIHCFWFLVQPDIRASRLDFDHFDRLYGDVPKGISIIANIAPEGPRNENRAKRGSFLPADAGKYRAFVKAAVERYDGDGNDDMPGLKNPVLYWQVNNEPSAAVKRDFSSLQLMTYETIKEACPQCQVLIGGAAHPILKFRGEFETNADQYFEWFSEHYEPILVELQGRGFDIFDFHWQGKATGDYKKIRAIYEGLRARLKKYNFQDVEIWVTEMSSYSGSPAVSEPLGAFALQTEKEQAADLLKRYVFSLSIGIRKVFMAFGLMEGFMKDDGYFDHTGLMYDGRGANDLGMGIRKLAYYAYKKMTEKLEGSDWSRIETIQPPNDTHIYRFHRSGKPVWVCWNDGRAPQSVAVPLPQGVQNVVITEAVPKYRAGKDVTDYSSAFNTIPWKFAANGLREIEFNLGTAPVFIEEK